MNEQDKTGILLNANNIKLQRFQFKEMTKLIGIRVLYRAVKEGKKYTTYGEIDANYEPPIMIGCIFHDHPSQQTMKKLGWVTELDTQASLIEVEYDLPNLQVGALFIVPGGIDNSKGRLFRVSKISNSMIYPVSITCELVPEYEDVLNKNEILKKSFSEDSSIIKEEPDQIGYKKQPIKIKEEEDIWS